MKLLNTVLTLSLFSSYVYAENVKQGNGIITINVKNDFKKRKRQVLTDENAPHTFKVCLSENKKICTQNVSLQKGETHEFVIKKEDVDFASIFDSNGWVKLKSLEVITSDNVVCSHEDEADKQFYPSAQIPYDESDNTFHPSHMDVTLHRMVGGIHKWNSAYCSIRYRNEDGKSKLAIVNFAEIRNFCSANHIPNRLGVYQYSGHLPKDHYLAKGMWADDMSVFTTNEIRHESKFLSRQDFCVHMHDRILRESIIEKKLEYKELEKNVQWYIEQFQAESAWNSLNTVFDAFSMDSISTKFRQDLIMGDHKHLPKLPYDLDKFSLDEQNKILDEYIAGGQSLHSELKTRYAALIFDKLTDSISGDRK